MQAVQVARFGDPDVLESVELPDPSPGPGEIVIDVTHAAVGLIDLLFRAGRFKDQPGMPQPPFVPGLEVTGTVRALGDGASGFAVGERVVSLSNGGTGGYASVFIAQAALTVSLDGYSIDPALAVSVVPNAAMAHVALSRVAHLAAGENVLIHGALGGFSAAFPGMAKTLGAGRVVGTVRTSKLQAAATTKLPYDKIVDSAGLPEAAGEERFDIVIDPVGGQLRDHSLDLLRPGGRLIACGNASEDWSQSVQTSRLWLASTAVIGFNAGAYLPAHPDTVRPALEAAIQAVAAGLGQTEVDVLPFSQAVTAHQRMTSRSLNGRIALTPDRPAQ